MRAPLLVTGPGAKLTLSDGTISVVRADSSGPSQELPLRRISSIVSYGAATISPSLLETLLRLNIPYHVFSLSSRYIGSICSAIPRTNRWSWMYWPVYQSSAHRSQLATEVLVWKLQTMQALALRISERLSPRLKIGPRKFINLSTAQTVLLRNKPLPVEKLLGVEGYFTKWHYQILALGISTNRSSFTFQGRTRRPPRDCFNALLSFLYCLLLSEVTVAACDAGFDVSLGFLHSSFSRPKPALALDLMEPFRSMLAERLALRLVNLGMITEENFEPQGSGIYLNELGRKVVAKEWLKLLCGSNLSQGPRQRIRERIDQFKIMLKAAYASLACRLRH